MGLCAVVKVSFKLSKTILLNIHVEPYTHTTSLEMRPATRRVVTCRADGLASVCQPVPPFHHRPPQRAHQGAQHLPHMAQLAESMRYQVHAAIPAVRPRKPKGGGDVRLRFRAGDRVVSDGLCRG